MEGPLCYVTSSNITHWGSGENKPPVSLDCRVQTVQVDCVHGLYWSVQNLHILAGIFSLDILYLDGKSPLLMRNIQVNIGDILPVTSKRSEFWDMGVNSNLNGCPCSVLMKRASQTIPVYQYPLLIVKAFW